MTDTPTYENVPLLINDRWTIQTYPERVGRLNWPEWEKQRLDAMWRAIRPGDIVYDIGAEEGDLTALYGTWGARVVPVESNPAYWPNIRYHWEANRLPAPEGWFVGLASNTTEIEPDRLNFDTGAQGDWPVCAYGELRPEAGFRHLWESYRATPQIRLDDLVARLGVIPDVVTMDVEGAELRVLKGAEQVLWNVRPTVFVSVHKQFMWDLYSEHEVELHSFMADCGYTERFLGEDHEAHFVFLP